VNEGSVRRGDEKSEMHSVSDRLVIPVMCVMALVFVGVACAAGMEPRTTPAVEPADMPGPTPTRAAPTVSVVGPDCPGGFQANSSISEDVEIGVGGSLTLTVGSTPSIPCWWQFPEIGDGAIVRQVDHQSKWPAEGATPQPGAPGTEIWIFETLVEGESAISLPCVCLGEEGQEEEVRGTFVVNVVSVGIQ